MLDELKRVAAEVDRVLEHDDFPAAIVPQFLREAVVDYPRRGGKRLRPALTVWSCGALGGGESRALYPAVACEVFHNWTLVHDDIIDDDDFRRGAPTSHKQLQSVAGREMRLTDDAQIRFGRDFAILCGDLQQAWANSLLLKAPGVRAEVLLAIAARMQSFANRELVSGEALDVAMSYIDIDRLRPDDVERMFEKKTGVLFQFCVETGAMIALDSTTNDHPQIIPLAEMAMNAAVAFQMRDDYLGIFGAHGKFGKPIGSDIAERKVTMLLLYALESLGEGGKKELLSFFGRPDCTAEDMEKVRTIYRESGALEKAAARAAERTAAARAALEKLPESPYRRSLGELLDYLLEREV
ncbi:MAG: polyprenyl synthetase family protein [Victivallaceae bacterium]|nr:polyprenyl synthetase family protein [Victivallaceae bacterium]